MSTFTVVHQLGGPEVPENRTCSPARTKCIGAADRTRVPYAACCDAGLVCGVPLAPGSTWGSYCLPAAEVSSVTPVPATAPAAPTTAAAPVTTVASGTTAAGRTGNTTAAPAGGAAGANTSATDPAAAAISPSPAANNDSGKKCFPSSATVELEDGAIVTMSKLSIGDMVKVGPNAFSKVFMFTHKMESGDNEFVKITTSSGASIALTSGHYIPVDGALVAASEVSIGSVLQLGNGASDKVVSIATVAGTGLYNPQTVQGDIVVDGVVASTYTTAVEPEFAHAILAPFRSLSNFLGVDFTFLESGGGPFADAAPRGSLVF
jgi:hypothetical protein